MIRNTKTLPILLSFLVLVVFLYVIFSGRLILPQALFFGRFTIHYYGLIMALAVAGGFYLAVKTSETYGLTKKQAEDVLFWVIIGGFIGARLYHVLSSFGYYQHNAIGIFKVWYGGLSIYGAVLGGFLTLYLYERLNKDAPWQPRGILALLNWLTPSLILGQIIGRFGNLFNYEAFGYPTNLPWKMFVPAVFRPDQYQTFNFFHPWFLYEQIGLLIIFFVINKFRTRHNPHLFLYYLLLYNILRFALEFLRIDSVFLYGVRQNAVVSFLLIIFTVILILQKTGRLGTKKYVSTS